MPLSHQAQAVVDAFGQQPGVTAEQLRNLKATIAASPALAHELNDAVAHGHLTKIVPLTNPHAGGEYNAGAHEMRLPLSMLITPTHGHFNAGEPTFVLGHELQHGLNAATTAQAQSNFTNALKVIAQSPAPTHNYTAPIGQLISANRRDEAGAEISGWNAVVSAARQDATHHHRLAPTLADIYARNPGRMADFIDVDRSHFPPTYAAKPNLTLNADLSMSTTAHNVEGMGKNYFDRGSGLGHNGNSNYNNYYGAWAVGVAANYERSYNPPQPAHGGHVATPTSQMNVDLGRLHLSPRIMAENGINLGSHTQPMPYVDNSTRPPTHARFNHTINTHTYTPLEPAPAVANPLQTTRDVVLLDHADHPDHSLYQAARGGVHALDAKQGRAPDQRSDNLAAALAVAARRDGMQEINHVVLSANAVHAFAVQGSLQSPLRRFVRVDTEQAVQTSIAQSSATWVNLAVHQQPPQNLVEPSLVLPAPSSPNTRAMV